MTTTLLKHIIKKWAFFPRQKERQSKPHNPHKKWIASVKGYYPIGLSCCEVYWNLYEDESGNRSYKEYSGRELSHVPRKADFSVKAQVDAWVHSNAPLQHTILRQSLFTPLAECDLQNAQEKRALNKQNATLSKRHYH